MKMIERNKTAEAAALLIHPMLSSAEGIELCVTRFWGDSVHCFLPDLSSHGAAAGVPQCMGRGKSNSRLSGRAKLHAFAAWLRRVAWRCGAV